MDTGYATVAAVRDRLEFYYQAVNAIILSRQNACTGLIPASVAVTTHGDYRDAWVRDNVYSIYAVFGLALAYRRLDDDMGRGYELEHAVIKCMRGLLFCMMRQAHKVEQFKESQHVEHCLHAKYNTATGATVVGDKEWGHLQLDATSFFVLALAEMTACGMRIIFTLDEVDFVQNLVFYIERAYRTPDYGIWERGNKINHGMPELNSSSIGMAVAALEAINGLNLFGAQGGSSSVIHVLPDEITRNWTTLHSALPRESYSKEVDAALLSVIGFPAFAVADVQLYERTKFEIRKKLGGRYGCKRFLRDGHQTAVEDTSRLHYDAHELKVFEDIESEWPLFFTYFVLDGLFHNNMAQVEEFRALLEPCLVDPTKTELFRQGNHGADSTEDSKVQSEARNNSRSISPFGFHSRGSTTGSPGLAGHVAAPTMLLVPELYVVPADRVQGERDRPHSQERIPNENIPLVWAQSLYILGNLIYENLLSAAEVDPLGRRLSLEQASNRTDTVVQIVLLSESAALQARLATLGLETQTIEQCHPVVIGAPGALREAYRRLGANSKLGLTGRPKRPVGTLSTCKLYRCMGQLLAFTPHFMDREEFYLVSDSEYLLSVFEQELQFVKRHWRQRGRPTMVVVLTAAMLGNVGRARRNPDVQALPSGLSNVVDLSSTISGFAGSGVAGAASMTSTGASSASMVGPRNLLNFMMSLRTGLCSGVRVRLGRLSELIPTACVESLDFLLSPSKGDVQLVLNYFRQSYPKGLHDSRLHTSNKSGSHESRRRRTVRHNASSVPDISEQTAAAVAAGSRTRGSDGKAPDATLTDPGIAGEALSESKGGRSNRASRSASLSHLASVVPPNGGSLGDVSTKSPLTSPLFFSDEEEVVASEEFKLRDHDATAGTDSSAVGVPCSVASSAAMGLSSDSASGISSVSNSNAAGSGICNVPPGRASSQVSFLKTPRGLASNRSTAAFKDDHTPTTPLEHRRQRSYGFETARADSFANSGAANGASERAVSVHSKDAEAASQFDASSITSTEEGGSPNEILTLTLHDAAHVGPAVQLLTTSTNLFDQADLLHYLYSCHGPDFAIDVLGNATVCELLEEVYVKAMFYRLWSVVRQVAGLLRKVVNSLTINVTDLLIRQKPVTVGFGSLEHTFMSPMSPHLLAEIIYRHCNSDVREAPLVQEVLIYLGSFIRSQPSMFAGIMRVRVHFFIIAMREEISRLRNCNEEDAVEHLMQLSPFAIKSLLGQVLTACEQTSHILVSAPALVPSTAASRGVLRSLSMSAAGRPSTAGPPLHVSTAAVSTASTLAIVAQSGGYLAGNFALLELRRDDAPVQVPTIFGRGLNVIVLSPADGAIVETGVFDTHFSAEESDEFARLIEWLEPRTVVVVIAKDDCSEHLTEAAKAALEALGSARARQLRYRDSFCLIGEKNAARGSVPEALRAANAGPTAAIRLQLDLAARRSRYSAGGMVHASSTGSIHFCEPALADDAAEGGVGPETGRLGGNVAARGLYPFVGPSNGRWLRRRKNDGALNRVPPDFYPKVWKVLSRCQGFRIHKGSLPRDPTVSEKTPEEFNFALQVESILDVIRDPAERQIAVELLMVISKIQERNPELSVGNHWIDLGRIIRDAVQRFWQKWVRDCNPAAITAAVPADAPRPASQVFTAGGANDLVQGSKKPLPSSNASIPEAAEPDALLKSTSDSLTSLDSLTTPGIADNDWSFERNERVARRLFFDLPQEGPVGTMAYLAASCVREFANYNIDPNPGDCLTM